jgi:beta,beta-carotene 9',10'-dioxygenase
MKLFNTFLLSANCQVNYDRDVRACTQSTSYVGPDNFQYDLKNVLRTATPVPEATEMKLNFGRVPEWINGHWFRTGPGIYEFGDDEYMGLADPLAIWSRITFDQGSVTFKSDFQYGSHHTRNAEVGSIMFPEMSTWGNPADCDAENDPDNSKLIEFLTEDPDFVSDNNYVSYWAVGGGLYASGETYFVWQIDPITLKGVRKINLSELFQETVFKNNRKYNAKIGHTRCTSLATHLAHYHYDKVTDEYFGAFTCMTDGFVPGIEYVFYKIPDAFQGLKSKPETPEEVWGRAVIIGQVPSKHNSAMHLDFGQEYFHDFAITENYIIFGTTGILIDFLKMPELMITRTPLAYGAAFYEEAECSWYVMDRKSGEIKEYPTTPFFATHVMNAFEQEVKKSFFNWLEVPN